MHLISSGTLVILITSTSEFSFIFLFTSFLKVCQFFSLLILFLVNITFFFGRIVFRFFPCLVFALVAVGEHVSVGKGF